MIQQFGVFLGDLQKPVWHGLEQPAEGGPAWAGGLNRITFRDPFQPHLFCHLVILWLSVPLCFQSFNNVSIHLLSYFFPKKKKKSRKKVKNWHYQEESVFLFFVFFYCVFIHIGKISLSYIFSRLSIPNSLSSSSYDRVFSLLSIFLDLCWTQPDTALQMWHCHFWLERSDCPTGLLVTFFPSTLEDSTTL